MAYREREEARTHLMTQLAGLSRRERLHYLMQSAFRSYGANERGGEAFRRLLDSARARFDDDRAPPARLRVRP